MANQIIELLPEDNLLRAWLDTWEHIEPPRSFLLLAAISALGSAIGRKVWWDYDGKNRVYPMISTLLIAKSGVGKNVSMNHACRGLLGAIPVSNRPQIIMGAITPEKLHLDLRGNPKTLLRANELAAFFSKQKYMEHLVPYVTNLLDYEPAIERRTLSGDIVRVVEPSVTVLGGSTKEWLTEQLPHAANEGGFLARFLIVSETKKYKKVADPLAQLSESEKATLDAARTHIEMRLARSCCEHTGQIHYSDPEAGRIYEKWYLSHTVPTGYLAPFAARAGEMVRRLSIMMALTSERFAISPKDVQSAIDLYLHATKSLHKIVVPFSWAGKMQAMILDSVAEQAVSQIGLRNLMINWCNSDDTDKLVRSLVQAGKIRLGSDGKFHLEETE